VGILVMLIASAIGGRTHGKEQDEVQSGIGCYDAAHTIESVIFENFRMNGKLATSADDIELFNSDYASNISFR
jgi:hypothetical protein